MSEFQEQVQLFHQAAVASGRYPELRLLFAIPNGAKLPWSRNAKGQRYSPEAQKLIAQGLKSGVPDVFLAVPRGEYSGLFIELKYGKNKPSEVQAVWIEMLRGQGYRAEVCWGCKAAWTVICEYLGIMEA